jgi:hypothetical protein
MPHPISLNRWPALPGLALLLIASAVPGVAQMNMGSQNSMEEMGAAPVQPKPASKVKPAPGGGMSMAPAAKTAPVKPEQGMATMSPAPASEPAPKGGMSMAPAAQPAQPASTSGMEGMAAAPGEAAKGMEEPTPSSLNGGLILGIFAALNAGIIAIAAVLKAKRNHLRTSSEVNS